MLKDSAAVQCGVTPNNTEVPRCMGDQRLQQRMSTYTRRNQATQPSAADLKWRFFWPLLTRAARQAGQVPDLERVVPAGMPGWADTLEGWGCSLLDTVETVSELLALAYGLPRDAFQRLLRDGRHLLAPTGVDLKASCLQLQLATCRHCADVASSSSSQCVAQVDSSTPT